ncbi:MAG: mismatch-specific DNA-glycosylase [Bdellovibrionaceae bacterium]|nr:mismatch-specific DNA-glycosylase [Pseudobdellovibrionaceae bacterium]
MPDPVLPDLFCHDLKVIFCGSRPGDISAKRKAYYAHPGNKFWSIIYEIGLLPRLYRSQEYELVRQQGIGLTDLGKDSYGQDKGWKATETDVLRLRSQILKWQPQVLAFTSKTSAQYFLGRKVQYGLQSEKMGNTFIFALPSTSGANRGHWDKVFWFELAQFLKNN